MEISTRQVGKTTVVAVAGTIDALNASDLTAALLERISAGDVHLVVDLSGVDFMSSSGLRSILAGLKESRQRGGDLRLAGASASIEKVLQMSGFTTILKDYPSVDQAVASYAG